MKNNDKRIIHIYIYIYFQQFVSPFFHSHQRQKRSTFHFFAAIGIKYRDAVSLNGKIVDIYIQKIKKNTITIFQTIRFIISHSDRDKSSKKKRKKNR